MSDTDIQIFLRLLFATYVLCVVVGYIKTRSIIQAHGFMLYVVGSTAAFAGCLILFFVTLNWILTGGG